MPVMSANNVCKPLMVAYGDLSILKRFLVRVKVLVQHL